MDLEVRLRGLSGLLSCLTEELKEKLQSEMEKSVRMVEVGEPAECGSEALELRDAGQQGGWQGK